MDPTDGGDAFPPQQEMTMNNPTATDAVKSSVS